MNKKITAVSFIPLLISVLTGCGAIGDKSTSVSVIYGATTLFSFLLLVGYFTLIRKKSVWFYLLFTSVLVVNLGYLWLALSTELSWALHANRVAYLGSVFLPFSMFMIISDFCKLKKPVYVNYILLSVSILVFLVAASPGYLDIYYKSVSLETVNGVSMLVKEYGPWHSIYLFYRVLYFVGMISIIIYSAIRKKMSSAAYPIIMLIAVFCNICVWLLEQLVKIDFEFLSVSYIVTELFLIAVHLMIQDTEKMKATALPDPIPTAEANPAEENVTEEAEDLISDTDDFETRVQSLTPTETRVYCLYVEGKGTKEIMQILNIKENTLKYHNKNIYGKLGVSSRKELLAKAMKIKADV